MRQLKPLSLVYGEYGANTGFRTRIEMIKRLLNDTLGTPGDWLTFERGLEWKTVQPEGTNRVVRLPRTKSAGSLVKHYLAAMRGAIAAELDQSYDLIIAHSFNSTFVANALKKRFRAPVLLDVHGLWLEEVLSWSRDRPAVKEAVLKRIEHTMLKSAKGLIFASNQLQELLLGKYPDLARRPSIVVPCLPDLGIFTFDSEGRENLRKSWGWEDCTVVVHSGIKAPWVDVQGIGHLLKTGEDIPGVRFLFLTNQPAEWTKVVGEVNDKTKVKILPVLHEDMPAYLSAADVGLVARIDSPINRVSSPTKIAEYLATGLPVLMTVGIGECDVWVKQNHLGKAFPNLISISKKQLRQILSSFVDMDKDRIARWAKNNLSICSHYDSFLKICEQVVEL